MPNHFEFNSDSFENLLNNVDNVHEEPTNSEAVIADTAVGREDLLNTTTTESTSTEDPDSSQEPKNEDFLMSFLSEYGLRDGKVVYENEDGSTDTVNFNDLDSEENEKKMARMEAMIHSMTPEERSNPDLLNPSRKHRIARGAGVDIAEVNRMVKQFNESRKMMKKLPGMMGGKGGKRGRFRLPF